LREVLNVTYAFLCEGRSQEQIEELNEILENPAMSEEERAARKTARQMKQAGTEWAQLSGPKPKPLRPRQRPPEAA
jgi:hypothetical protein